MMVEMVRCEKFIGNEGGNDGTRSGGAKAMQEVMGLVGLVRVQVWVRGYAALA